MIRKVTLNDAKDITEIYNHYIKNTCITFEEEEVDEEIIRSRIKSIEDKYFWIVYEEEKRVVAYAYVSEFKSRVAYKNSVESSIYLHKDIKKKGIGSKLYAEIIKKCKERNFHTILGIVTLPNDASVSIHEKFGFKKVAHFKEVGYKFNSWIDVGSWQLLLK